MYTYTQQGDSELKKKKYLPTKTYNMLHIHKHNLKTAPILWELQHLPMDPCHCPTYLQKMYLIH